MLIFLGITFKEVKIFIKVDVYENVRVLINSGECKHEQHVHEDLCQII